MSHTTTSQTEAVDTRASSAFAQVMSLLDQTGIGYEVVYTGSDRSCPLDLTPARAA
jgi:hypothetical protein